MTLDELHDKFHEAEIRFDTGSGEQRGRVMGVTKSLPLVAGGEDQPALVVSSNGRTGHVYPHEVTFAYRDEYGQRREIVKRKEA